MSSRKRIVICGGGASGEIVESNAVVIAMGPCTSEEQLCKGVARWTWFG